MNLDGSDAGGPKRGGEYLERPSSDGYGELARRLKALVNALSTATGLAHPKAK